MAFRPTAPRRPGPSLRRPPAVTVIGVLAGHPLSAAAGADLDAAELVIGSAECLELTGPHRVATRPLPAGDALVDLVHRAGSRRVVVVVTGDPGFFGIVPALARAFGRQRLRVHPAPSVVAVAFARLGLPWDDAVTVSAAGQGLGAAVQSLITTPAVKAAVLLDGGQRPEEVGIGLLRAGSTFDHAAVCADLGTFDEQVTVTDLDGLAEGPWFAGSTVVLWQGDGLAGETALRWGPTADGQTRRGGMFTRDEVRAVILAKLELPATGVLWDVGAGSGSLAIEAAALAPGLDVYAIEQRPDDITRIYAHAQELGVRVTVVAADAVRAAATLPPPDRIFVGGGGPTAVDATLPQLLPGGRMVVTSATLSTALGAYSRLGRLVQVAVSQGEPVGLSAVRLAPAHEVFVAWGPLGDSAATR